MVLEQEGHVIQELQSDLTVYAKHGPVYKDFLTGF
jgi:hypothetical protein